MKVQVRARQSFVGFKVFFQLKASRHKETKADILMNTHYIVGSGICHQSSEKTGASLFLCMRDYIYLQRGSSPS